MSVALWKPDAVFAYCSGTGNLLIDSGPHRLDVILPQPRTWNLIPGHLNRLAVVCDAATTGGPVAFTPESYEEGFTVTAWLKPSTIKDAPICGVRTASNTGFIIRVTSNAVLNALRYGASAGTISTPAVFSAGEWTHFAVHMAPANMALFINGVRRGPFSADATAIIGVSTIGVLGFQNFYQGAGGVVSGGFEGEIADLCIWPKILDGDEIDWLAKPRHNILSIPRAGFPLSRILN